MNELKPIGLMFSAGDFQEGLARIHALWDAVPEPKVETANAYLIIEYGAAFSLKIGDLQEARQWADRAPAFAAKRQDMGEVEFLVGKIAFECGDMEKAREQFLAADAKSEGRAFQGKDKRYRQLIA